jgi:Ca2+-binding RTX toxin-like protein
VLNFDGLPTGTVLGEQYAFSGIHISAIANEGRPNNLIIFDSNATGTPDPFMEAGIGNLAIIPENITDADNNTLVDVPNNSIRGGVQIYSFDTAQTVGTFKIVDIDHGDASSHYAAAYDGNGNLIKQVPIPIMAEGAVQTVSVNATGVRRLEIVYRDSAGVGDIEVCPGVRPTPTPVQAPCLGDVLLDFAGLPAGTILSEQYAADGIHIAGDAYDIFPDNLIVFDSNATGTPDPNLERGIGKLAIFPDNLTNDEGSDDLVDEPNASIRGGVQVYTFDGERVIGSFTIVGVDNGHPSSHYGAAYDAVAYNSSNNLIAKVPIPILADGAAQTITLNASGVRRLEIVYRDAAGVTDIEIKCPAGGPVPTPSPTPAPTPPTTPVPTPPPSPTPQPALCQGVPVTIPGTNGDDHIEGTPGPDVIDARGGNDKIDGKGGNDVICAGDGSDKVFGGDGDDRITGGDGCDLIFGGNGDDVIAGEGDKDLISGDAGHDTISGGDEIDLILGGDGNDVVSGGAGADFILGGAGNDQLAGDDGNDWIFGNDGNDSLDGDAGTDSCNGGLGTDTEVDCSP